MSPGAARYERFWRAAHDGLFTTRGDPDRSFKPRRAKAASKLLSGEGAELAELEAHGASLQDLAEAAPDILFILHARGAPTFVNRRYYEYTGLPPGAPVATILGSVMTEDLESAAAALLSGNSDRIQHELRLRGRDGTYRWFLVRASRMETPKGVSWFGVATDIDEVKTGAKAILALNTELNQVLSSISDCYYTIDRDWRMISANQNALDWMGADAETLIGKDIRTWITPRARLWQAIEHGFETGEAFHIEWESSFRAGKWIELHGYPAAQGISIFFRDITERKADQFRIEESRALLQGSLDALTAEIALLDSAGRIVMVNEAWRRHVSRDGPDDGVGQSYEAFSARALQGISPALVARALDNLRTGRTERYERAFVASGPNGPSWRQLRITRFEHGGHAYFLAANLDVTDVARAQAALRDMSGRLLSIQEEERQRIAIELHDSTSQHLVALGLGITRLRRSLGSSGSAVASVLSDMGTSVREALKEIRVFSYLLNPPNLAAVGLEVTARKFVSGFGQRTGLAVSFRQHGPLDHIDSTVQRTVFRVIQEALSNVHRHAQATLVDIELNRTLDYLTLRVRDNGTGMRADDAATADDTQLGVGIPGMRARLAQLGGTLKVSSADPGTTLEAVIPLEPGLSAPAGPRAVPA